jgi:hypothetical protein
MKKIKTESQLIDVLNKSRWEEKIHEHGLVALVDVMPRMVPENETCDGAIVQAARVSYGEGTKTINEDSGLIRYLMRHRHTTPLEMCLSGDTRIPTMPCPHATRKTYTIKQISDAFANGGKENSWVKLLNIRTVDADGTIRSTKIKLAKSTGYKETFRLRTEGPLDREIELTDNHPILTSTGYKTLKELKIGDKILANGSPDLKEMWDGGYTLQEIGTHINRSYKMLAHDSAGYLDGYLKHLGEM